MSESNEEKDPKTGGMKAFTTIWIGQVLSLLGSGLTSFALGIWVLQRSESVTQFALIAVIAGLPGVLLAPIAGTLVDRWDRRRVLIWADVGSGITTLVIAVLLYQDMLAVWHIYIAVALSSACAAFQWPAYIAAITMLVDKKHYTRVNGMIQFGQSGSTIAAPFLAGLLMYTIDIWGVLILDGITFVAAVIALLLVKIPNPEPADHPPGSKGSLFKEALYGWTYIKERPGLMGLLFFFAGINLVVCMCGVAILPMVIRFSSELGGGTVMSFGGAGMLLGSLYLSVTGGPKKKINGVLGFGMLFSVGIFLAGLTPTLWVVCLGVLLWNFNIPVINGCSQAIWQAKIAPGVQGRVFAMRRMIAQFTVPIGDFSAGPLSDYVFEPLMAEDGKLAGPLGSVIGTGPGRGIALMLIVFAIFPFLTSLWGWLNPRIRNIEEELPDADVLAAQEAKEKEVEEAKADAEQSESPPQDQTPEASGA